VKVLLIEIQFIEVRFKIFHHSVRASLNEKRKTKFDLKTNVRIFFILNSHFWHSFGYNAKLCQLAVRFLKI